MRKSNVARLLLIADIGAFLLAWIGVQNYLAYAFSPHHYAIEELSKAATAQTPDEVIQHITYAKLNLPKSGSISWLSPEKGDFNSIQVELDGLIERVQAVSSLESDDPVYISEMLAIHERLMMIQNALLAF